MTVLLSCLLALVWVDHQPTPDERAREVFATMDHGNKMLEMSKQNGKTSNHTAQKTDPKSRYLLYLHGKIVERARRPTSPQYGVYEYDQILDTFKQRGFVVISEQRSKDTDVEQYAKKVAEQVRDLIKSGVPPAQITVVGASQGSWIAMLASTYLKNRSVNFVLIAACSADEGFLKQIDLHGNVLSIYERSDLAGSCEMFREDATGLGEYKEIELNTKLRHGFIYRPLTEWVEPTIAWAMRVKT